MKIVALICRILLGALFAFSGANILHPFSAMPAPVAGTPVGDWSLVMMNSGWMHWVGALQLIGGLLVLVGGTLPLGLCILCPITVNILLFHMTLTGGHGIAAGLVTALFEIVLIYAYRGSFSGILTAKATPST